MIKNRWHLLQRASIQRSKRIQPPPSAAPGSLSMSLRLKLPGQQHHAVGAYSSNQVAYLNSEDVSSSTTDTWYPLSSYSVEFMMDDGLIMVRPNHDFPVLVTYMSTYVSCLNTALYCSGSCKKSWTSRLQYRQLSVYAAVMMRVMLLKASMVWGVMMRVMLLVQLLHIACQSRLYQYIQA